MPMVFQVLNSLEAAKMKIVRVTNIFVVHRYSTQVSFRFLVFSLTFMTHVAFIVQPEEVHEFSLLVQNHRKQFDNGSTVSPA